MDPRTAVRGELVPAAPPSDGRRYGSDVVVDLLQHYDIPYVALNPGSSFRGLHDSLVNYGANQPEMILCQHEEIAVGMAHGYAKASGKPMAAIVHDVVGLLHSCMAIYYAYIDRAPVLVLGATGPLNEARRRPRIDWIHTANVQGSAVRDYTKWDDQPASVDGIPGSFARAYRVAMNPDAARAPTRMAADPTALRCVAEMLLAAERPVIMAEFLGRDHDAFDALVRLAESLSVPVYDVRARLNFPTQHPLNMTGTDILAEADLILALDVRDFERATTRLDSTSRTIVPIVRPDCKFVEIGFADLELSSWSMDYGRLQETCLSVLGDTSLAVPALTDQALELLADDHHPTGQRGLGGDQGRGLGAHGQHARRLGAQAVGL